jgi:glycosyltransferase involved in cell wall biosynthesis
LNRSITLHLTLNGDIEDSSYWEKCSSEINALPGNISVSWEGPVANDKVPEALNKYHLFVLPTKGENFGHAIFEALSSGKPVLISDQTPWRNLQQKKIGWDLPLDEPRLFQNAIEEIAGFDQQEYDLWSQNAWTYAHDFTSRLNLKEDYLKLFS